MSKDVKRIDLTHDLTQTDLMRLLNQKYGAKKFSTKTPEGRVLFNAQDVQGYIKRGALPLKYGGNKVSVIKSSSSIVVLKVKEIEKILSLPDFEEDNKENQNE